MGEEIIQGLRDFIAKVKSDPGISWIFRDALAELEKVLSPPPAEPVETPPVEQSPPVEGGGDPASPPPADPAPAADAPEPPVAPAG